MVINFALFEFSATQVLYVGLAIFLAVTYGALRLAKALRRRSAKRSVPEKVVAPPRQAFATTIYDLVGGERYAVVRDFADFYGAEFRRGELLTYRGMNFLPYHDGYTLNFAERTIYLHGEANVEILQNTNAYLQPAPENSPV